MVELLVGVAVGGAAVLIGEAGIRKVTVVTRAVVAKAELKAAADEKRLKDELLAETHKLLGQFGAVFDASLERVDDEAKKVITDVSTMVGTLKTKIANVLKLV
jgi:hypothetical protein